ncbi:ATP-binding cassette sub-family D member 3-like [Oscarella lobularis]|uniref:ATP-binding cassette sub-family D member 3-like n=1 Tax=Oscarella lobularis TaxID=121494 RepID=UPI0033134E7F
MSVFSKFVASVSANPQGAACGALLAAGAAFVIKQRMGATRRKPSKSAIVVAKTDEGRKAAVDSLFFKRLWTIIKIIIPGLFTKESGYLIFVAASLVARTYCDLWMIQTGTAIESAIIGRSIPEFKSGLFKFIYAMPLLALMNNLLKFGLDKLKLCFRIRLTSHLYQIYLKGFVYYKMANLDNRIANADQLLTQDVEKFCNTFADLYSNLTKPILDIFLFAKQLAMSIGYQGPGMMFGYLILSGWFLTRLRHPTGRLTAAEQQLEGNFRFVNSRLITNSEEVAFYQGDSREKVTIMNSFHRLVTHLNKFIKFRLSVGIVDSIVAKYLATTLGYMIVSRPFLNLTNPKYENARHSQLLEDYYNSGRTLVRMSQATGRVVLAGREMTKLAGYAARVSELMVVLQDLNRGMYQRTMVTNHNHGQTESTQNETDDPGQPLVPGSGTLILQDHVIKFDHVPLVTPNGDVLVKNLDFEVRSGMNCLVCGPNGCGKSSLFRILGELWPLFGGRLVKPDKSKLFYVPQRPYMTVGTLRDQLIYPDTKQQMSEKGLLDAKLAEYLQQVHLGYLLERENGWDAEQDWMDVLSGGEKQRIAMARLFYHKPQFAILDECTSAVSVDVEGFMYTRCREVGITLFTVSHRKSLWKYHEYVLQFDGRGSCEFKRIDPETDEFGS